MRHIRDPITGRCMVCESGKAPHGHTHAGDNPQPSNANDPKAQPMWDDVRKKIIYVNAFSSTSGREQPPRQGSPKPRSPSPDSGRGSTAASTSQVQFNPKSNTVNPVFIAGGSPGVYRYGSPPPRYESPQPREKHYNRLDAEKNSRYPNRGNRPGQAAYHDGSTYQGASWGRRRCCTVLWAFLVILLLAALAVGIYFLIQYIEEQNDLTDPANTNPGGTFQDGVYVIQSTKNPQETFFIYGTDTPCNPYNNNTIGSNNITNPNCNKVTTNIVPVTYTTTTPVPANFVTTATATDVTSSLFCILASVFAILLTRFKLY